MIVGTAGHIDHGKSALVHALTGVDTDRLKEEKARGISIDLGFAHMPAADGTALSFVDVPGHHRFVRNMLAGATGIDMVLLVVAADDGVMPQTLEHLAIVDLLGIAHGLVALTKVDLVGQARREEVLAEIRRTIAPTTLAGAPVLPVSSVTGEGVVELRHTLLAMTGAVPRRNVEGRFRLAVDRCFTMTGAGTIVTGTILSGSVAVGDSVTVSPAGLAARVRSIQSHNRSAPRAIAGERCGLNLAGERIARHAIARGDMVLDPVLHAPTARIDALLSLLAGEARSLAHWTPVHLHHAAIEVPARVALLEEAPIASGGRGRIQLVLDRPIAAAVGDRFILRDNSGSRTIGGGRFLDLRPPQRRRRTPDRLAQLDALGHEDPRDALSLALSRWPWFVDAGAFARDRALSEDQMATLLRHIPHRAVGQEPLLLAPEVWERLATSARAALDDFHRASPQLLGMGIARLARTMEPRLPAAVASSAVRGLIEAGILAAEGGMVRSPDHRLGLDRHDQQRWQCIAPLLGGEARFRPPRVGDIAVQLRDREFEVRRVLKAMARQDAVVEVAPDHFFLREVMSEIARIAARVAAGQEDGQFTAAMLRDQLANGRKVAIQILEWFDRHGLTLRQGDLRRINPARLKQFAADAGKDGS